MKRERDMDVCGCWCGQRGALADQRKIPGTKGRVHHWDVKHENGRMHFATVTWNGERSVVTKREDGE